MTATSTDPVRAGARLFWLAALCALALGLAAAPTARAERALFSTEAVRANEVPGGQIEGACGVALAGGRTYVSDYYRHAVDVFDGSGKYEKRISGNPLDGPCGLATSATGALYANDWHAGVSRLLPTSLSFDSNESTGVAVDQASGNVYVNDRTYVAVYEPSAATVEAGGEPLRIGLGTLGDGYGVAVASGKVYVPDAADNTVKVYEPAIDPVDPVTVIDGAATPQGRFVSLVDAAVAIDPSNGHLLVLDNLQPGFEHPAAALEEFDAAGNFLGQVAQKVIDGEPSGLAFSGGTLYVTSGNDEGAAVFAFGAYFAAPPALAPAAESSLAGAESSQSAGAGVAQSAVAGPPSPAAAVPYLRLAPGPTGVGASATLSVLSPGPGTLVATGSGLRALRKPTGGGRSALRLQLSRAGRQALARSKSRKLKVRVLVTFAPDRGAVLSARETATFVARDGKLS